MAGHWIVGGTIVACAFIAIALVSIIFIASIQLSPTFVTFVIFCSQDIASLIVLINFAWLGVDVIYGNLLLAIPNRFISLFFNLGWWPMFVHYVLVAFNRAHLMLWPNSYGKLWTLRFCYSIAASSWLLFGGFMNLANSFLIPANDSAHFTHSIDNFSFQREFYAGKDTDVLRWLNTSFCFLCIGLAFVAYTLAVFSVVVHRRVSPGRARKFVGSVEVRLTINCFLSLIPSTAYVIILFLQSPESVPELISKTLLGISAMAINSLLRPLFSANVRRNLPCGLWRLFPSKQPKNVQFIQMQNA